MSKLTSSWRFTAHGAYGYTTAVLAVAAAWLAILAFERLLGVRSSLLLLLCATVFAAWIAGTGPALLATASGLLAFYYLLVPSDSALALQLKNLVPLVLFAIAAIMAAYFGAAQSRAADALKKVRDEQQVAVQDLQELNEKLITENAQRKKAEERARLAGQELGATIDRIPALVARHRADGAVDFLNQTFRDYTGPAPNEAGPLSVIAAVLHPDDRVRVDEAWRANLKTGEPFEIEVRLRRYDGEYRWILLRRVPLRDDTGDVIAWYSAGHDIEARKRAEDALRQGDTEVREAKHELQLAIDTVATMIVVIAHDGTAYYANKPSREFLGSDLPIERVREAIHPDDRSMVERLWREHMALGEAFQTEQRMRRADGQYRWCFMTRVPMRDESGKVIRWYGSGYDIHDRKIAQDALAKSEAQLATAERELRLTLDLIPTLAWRARADGFVEYLNRRWLDYTGLTLGGALGWEWQVVIHPDDRSRLVAAWSRMLESGEPGEAEARMRRFDGSYRWFLFRTEALRDDRGTVIGWYGTNTDIEDRKKAERALQRSEAYLAEAEKLSRTGSFAWEMVGDNYYWSDEVYHILGFDRSVTPKAKGILKRVHPDDRANLRYEWERAKQRAGNFYDHRVRLLMDDGSTKHLHVRAHRAKFELGKEEIVGAVTDVTEAKMAQEARDTAHAALVHASRVATLGEISATIAHEVNQPLAAIVANAQGCLRFLQRENVDLNGVRGAIEWIVKDADRAGDVIRRVRGLLKKADTQKLALQVNEVVIEAVALLERELSTRGIIPRLDLAPGMPASLADRVQVQQVIINLAMNAVEAMQKVEERPRSLVINTYTDAADIVVAVKDSGTGISTESAERLFDAFFSTKASGLGIGLSLCRSIIEDHGGRLWADNNIGEPGAVFRFTLPAYFEGGDIASEKRNSSGSLH